MRWLLYLVSSLMVLVLSHMLFMMVQVLFHFLSSKAPFSYSMWFVFPLDLLLCQHPQVYVDFLYSISVFKILPLLFHYLITVLSTVISPFSSLIFFDLFNAFPLLVSHYYPGCFLLTLCYVEILISFLPPFLLSPCHLPFSLPSIHLYPLPRSFFLFSFCPA